MILFRLLQRGLPPRLRGRLGAAAAALPLFLLHESSVTPAACVTPGAQKADQDDTGFDLVGFDGGLTSTASSTPLGNGKNVDPSTSISGPSISMHGAIPEDEPMEDGEERKEFSSSTDRGGNKLGSETDIEARLERSRLALDGHSRAMQELLLQEKLESQQRLDDFAKKLRHHRAKWLAEQDEKTKGAARRKLSQSGTARNRQSSTARRNQMYGGPSTVAEFEKRVDENEGLGGGLPPEMKIVLQNRLEATQGCAGSQQAGDSSSKTVGSMKRATSTGPTQRAILSSKNQSLLSSQKVLSTVVGGGAVGSAGEAQATPSSEEEDDPFYFHNYKLKFVTTSCNNGEEGKREGHQGEGRREDGQRDEPSDPQLRALCEQFDSKLKILADTGGEQEKVADDGTTTGGAAADFSSCVPPSTCAPSTAADVRSSPQAQVAAGSTSSNPTTTPATDGNCNCCCPTIFSTGSKSLRPASKKNHSALSLAESRKASALAKQQQKQPQASSGVVAELQTKLAKRQDAIRTGKGSFDVDRVGSAASRDTSGARLSAQQDELKQMLDARRRLEGDAAEDAGDGGNNGGDEVGSGGISAAAGDEDMLRSMEKLQLSSGTEDSRNEKVAGPGGAVPGTGSQGLPRGSSPSRTAAMQPRNRIGQRPRRAPPRTQPSSNNPRSVSVGPQPSELETKLERRRQLNEKVTEGFRQQAQVDEDLVSEVKLILQSTEQNLTARLSQLEEKLALEKAKVERDVASLRSFKERGLICAQDIQDKLVLDRRKLGDLRTDYLEKTMTETRKKIWGPGGNIEASLGPVGQSSAVGAGTELKNLWQRISAFGGRGINSGASAVGAGKMEERGSASNREKGGYPTRQRFLEKGQIGK